MQSFTFGIFFPKRPKAHTFTFATALPHETSEFNKAHCHKPIRIHMWQRTSLKSLKAPLPPATCQDSAHRAWNLRSQSNLRSSSLKSTTSQLPQTNRDGSNLAEKALKPSCAYFPRLCLEALPLQGKNHSTDCTNPSVKHYTARGQLLSPWPSFALDNKHMRSLLTWGRVSLLSVVLFSQLFCYTRGPRCHSVSSYCEKKPLLNQFFFSATELEMILFCSQTAKHHN